MGNSGMDIQIALRFFLDFIFKDRFLKDLTIHKRKGRERAHYIVVIDAKYLNQRISSTGISSKLMIAYTKSIVELGEEIIRVREKYKCRSGIAGSLFPRRAKYRAKAELVERHVFFTNYRNQKKMTYLKSEELIYHKKSRLFDYFYSSSSDKKFNSVFAIERNRILASFAILHFGSATSKKITQACERALEECLSLDVFFNMNKSLFSPDQIFSKKYKSNFYKHLYAIWDTRNIEIFRKVFDKKNVIKKSVDIFNDFKMKKLKSPIWFIFFVKYENKRLIPIEFGKPEQMGKELYHPFW